MLSPVANRRHCTPLAAPLWLKRACAASWCFVCCLFLFVVSVFVCFVCQVVVLKWVGFCRPAQSMLGEIFPEILLRPAAALVFCVFLFKRMFKKPVEYPLKNTNAASEQLFLCLFFLACYVLCLCVFPSPQNLADPPPSLPPLM